MKNPHINSQARSDFNRARFRETLSRTLNILTPDREKLLSLQNVKEILKPASERYKGMQTVSIDRIIGSEGRYSDFSKTFLPKHDHTRGRWESIDKAHLADVILPPIKLYKIGDTYFVRDGNHRVSVAKTKGQLMIDAEVIELDTAVNVLPEMSEENLKMQVIAYEKNRVFTETSLGDLIQEGEMEFTATGRYFEVLKQIEVHKYYLNMNKEEELSFDQAAQSWYETLYKPITTIVEMEGLLSRFPGRTKADLYMWIIKHWDNLKNQYGPDFSMKEAAMDYSKKYGTGLMAQFRKLLRRNR